MKVDRTLIASITLHVLVLGWGLISFAARSFEVPEESLPVDIITTDQLAKMTAGIKNGEKDKPKPLVEKVAEAKPIDEAVGKVTEKEITTSTAPQPPPKPVEKPVEKKPDPPKQETKPKEAEKKPDPAKVDPIAEALKSEDAKKPKPKPTPQEAKAAPPQPPKPKQERVFDQSKIAQLLDKRDPTRQSLTGAALNSNAALGLHTGNSQAIVATWKGAFVAAVRRCFTFPYNGQDADQFEVDLDINLNQDGTVAGQPAIVGVRGPSRSVGNAMAESARRAVEQCQAYAFLPKAQYDTWKYIPMTFGLKDLL
ncbi:MAG: protein TolA [Bradyrhizobium sp.]|uniref:protein TolA n=1 Tax=Bradyrhizobium sp. TaxID=376 RepID=UPI001D7E9E63|nr:protein TolA [Bradyrhizobium sp.]MBV9564267.1 protein TolA [Bradyrhizobium sp.]